VALSARQRRVRNHNRRERAQGLIAHDAAAKWLRAKERENAERGREA
jgi:hypothetical protein